MLVIYFRVASRLDECSFEDRAAATEEMRLSRLFPIGRSTSTTLHRLPHRCHVTPNQVEPMNAISCYCFIYVT
jgi:hypothetical protein